VLFYIFLINKYFEIYHLFFNQYLNNFVFNSLQADNMSGNILIYENDLKKSKNLIRLPVSEEIKKLNREIKKKTRELLFAKNAKLVDDSEKGFFFV